MEQALLERAPAKLNLTLDVLGLRPDGYHELRSVMQTVSLYDDLTVRVNAPEWRIACATASVPHGEDNLILRAAREYVKRAGIETSGIEFALVKRIPMQAGLGGGSADAAACLRALDRIYGALPQDELLDVAASVGSDVPFCLLGGTRLCTGRGEKMTLLRRRGALLCRARAARNAGFSGAAGIIPKKTVHGSSILPWTVIFL